MNPTPDLETILSHAPRPEPPADLLRTLEQQIRFEPAIQPEPRAGLWRKWRRIWMPLAGLAGTAALALAIAAVWWLSTARTLGGSLKALGQMKSCHLVERFRSGRSRSIIRDKSKPAGIYPNYYTEEHPDNPLVLLDHWFQLDPRDPSRPLLRTASPYEDVWRQGNRVLTVNHKTGARSLKLVNAPNDILATLEPLAGLASLPLQEAKPLQEPDMKLDRVTGLWEGEARAPDRSLPAGAEMILRVWLNTSNQLPARFQILSTGFPQVAPEVLMREYQLTEFNAAFPEETFLFDITDQDVAPLGITQAELDAMGRGAISFDVTGESGAKVAGTVQDDAGTRQIQGTVPFTFVHDQHGDLKFELHMADGQRRTFGARFNNTEMQTFARRIEGKNSADGSSASIQGAD